MKRRGLRLAVFVLFLAALGGAGYGVWAVERDAIRDGAARDTVAAQAVRARLALAELQASQQAYVAAGQSADYWTARVAAGLEAVRTALGGLRESATADEARTALDAADSTIEDFAQVDRRAREQLAVNQTLFASDLIFADGIEMLRAAADHVEHARAAQEAALTERLGVYRRNEAWIVAGAISLGVLVALLLLPTGAGVSQPASAGAQEPAVEPDAGVHDALGAAIDAALGSSSTQPRATHRMRRLDMGATAELCADLARVTATTDLAALLARAARILDAGGIVLWVADPTGGELLPSVSHGYQPQALSRLGGIRRDSDNATAAAFRSGRMQVVAGQGGGSGAIIAPLLAVSGCVGVMTVEVKGQGEQDEGVRAAAGIIAAQLATLVSAAPAAAAPEAPKAKAE